MSRSFQALDTEAEIAKRCRNLPHWTQPGCTYFVTFRLADSLPQTKLRELKEEKCTWLKLHPKPWGPETWSEYELRFIRRIQQWLDAGYGSCALRRPDARRIVVDALHFFNGRRYHLDSFVVMPNHVHVLVSPLESDTGFPACAPGGTSLPSQAGKPASHDPQAGKPASRDPQAGKPVSHDAQAGKPVLLSAIVQSWKGYSAREINKLLCTTGRTFWMDESFDHAVRSIEHLQFYRAYIRENPAKAGLRASEYALWESDTGFPACDPQPGKAVSPT